MAVTKQQPVEGYNISDLYKTICTVTTSITFTNPVDMADCNTVKQELAARLPPGFVIDVYCQGRTVMIEVRAPGQHAPFYAGPQLIT